jgi:hypothetical protein
MAGTMFSKHYLRPTVVQTYSYFYNTDKAMVFKTQPQLLASLSKASCSTVPAIVELHLTFSNKRRTTYY